MIKNLLLDGAAQCSNVRSSTVLSRMARQGSDGHLDAAQDNV